MVLKYIKSRIKLEPGVAYIFYLDCIIICHAKYIEIDSVMFLVLSYIFLIYGTAPFFLPHGFVL